MIWRFPLGSEYQWARRAGAFVIALMVLAGGLCPALYGDQVPHQHLFVGGAPPADWQNHEHPNPLFTLLGPGTQSTESHTLGASANDGQRSAAGRVVSVYDGTSLVLSLMAVTVAIPLLDLPRPPDPGRDVVFTLLALDHLTSPVPATPPPRSS